MAEVSNRTILRWLHGGMYALAVVAVVTRLSATGPAGGRSHVTPTRVPACQSYRLSTDAPSCHDTP
jgi:hypothetical protein